jgi:hypothetical protein
MLCFTAFKQQWRNKMETINYKQYEIVLDPKSYWNEKNYGGDCIAKIYKGTELVEKTRFIYYKKKEIVKSLKEKINTLEAA